MPRAQLAEHQKRARACVQPALNHFAKQFERCCVLRQLAMRLDERVIRHSVRRNLILVAHVLDHGARLDKLLYATEAGHERVERVCVSAEAILAHLIQKLERGLHSPSAACGVDQRVVRDGGSRNAVGLHLLKHIERAIDVFALGARVDERVVGRRVGCDCGPCEFEEPECRKRALYIAPTRARRNGRVERYQVWSNSRVAPHCEKNVVRAVSPADPSAREEQRIVHIDVWGESVDMHELEYAEAAVDAAHGRAGADKARVAHNVWPQRRTVHFCERLKGAIDVPHVAMRVQHGAEARHVRLKRIVSPERFKHGDRLLRLTGRHVCLHQSVEDGEAWCDTLCRHQVRNDCMRRPQVTLRRVCSDELDVHECVWDHSKRVCAIEQIHCSRRSSRAHKCLHQDAQRRCVRAPKVSLARAVCAPAASRQQRFCKRSAPGPRQRIECRIKLKRGKHSPRGRMKSAQFARSLKQLVAAHVAKVPSCPQLDKQTAAFDCKRVPQQLEYRAIELSPRQEKMQTPVPLQALPLNPL
mmetsp:Transcript_11487/g.30957  ORF Transcript_11487/g.30957 Transcript_11487/m.30957 type:complete len:528 (+) Transcript_11487:58-1641(+)